MFGGVGNRGFYGVPERTLVVNGHGDEAAEVMDGVGMPRGQLLSVEALAR